MFGDVHNYPYLKPNRLGDVLAAIQTMALYDRYRVSCVTWADRISGGERGADHWKKVFEEHPEFFRPSSSKDNYSLVWRRANRRRFDRGNQETVSDAEYNAMSEEERKKVTRAPVPPDQIKTLVDMAIALHAKEFDRRRDRRWWVVPVLSFAGSIIGAVLAFVTAAAF